MPQLKLDHASIDYRIRRSGRAKRARLCFRADGLEVVAPLKMPELAVLDFVQASRGWIERTQRKLAARGGRAGSIDFDKGGELPLHGRMVPVTIRENRGAGVTVNFDGGLAIEVGTGLSREHRLLKARRALLDWLLETVAGKARILVEQHARRYALVPRSIQVRDQKTRWGSCGIHGDIYLNWRLVFAPEPVLEYVVVHELCHLRHRNHSLHFWSLVGSHLPDYQQQRIWLKNNGHCLMNAFIEESGRC